MRTMWKNQIWIVYFRCYCFSVIILLDILWLCLWNHWAGIFNRVIPIIPIWSKNEDLTALLLPVALFLAGEPSAVTRSAGRNQRYHHNHYQSYAFHSEQYYSRVHTSMTFQHFLHEIIFEEKTFQASATILLSALIFHSYGVRFGGVQTS